MANGRYGASAPGLDHFSRVNLLDAAGRLFRPRLYVPEDESGADIGKDIAAWVQHAWVWQGVRDRRAAARLRVRAIAGSGAAVALAALAASGRSRRHIG